MVDGEAQRFGRAVELAALVRMAVGANAGALARKLGLGRELVYQCRARHTTRRRPGARWAPTDCP